jgi:hypothetical protein
MSILSFDIRNYFTSLKLILILLVFLLKKICKNKCLCSIFKIHLVNVPSFFYYWTFYDYLPIGVTAPKNGFELPTSRHQGLELQVTGSVTGSDI